MAGRPRLALRALNVFPPTASNLSTTLLVSGPRSDGAQDPAFRPSPPQLVARPGMTNSTRRISYVVPFPPTPPPWLQLPSSTHPRNGSPYPLLFPSDHPPLSSHASIDPPSAHPQHSLGVPAMALDTSTQLAAQDGPQGILYTGGRDGLLAGWELGMRLRRRTALEGHEGAGKADWVRWNELGVDGLNDGADDEPTAGSGSGAPTPPTPSDRRTSDGEKLPFEDRWEVDKYAEGEVRLLFASHWLALVALAGTDTRFLSLDPSIFVPRAAPIPSSLVDRSQGYLSPVVPVSYRLGQRHTPEPDTCVHSLTTPPPPGRLAQRPSC
jgi:hypothetical protein